MTAARRGGRASAATARTVSWAGLGLLGYFLVVVAVITLAPFRFAWPRAPRLMWTADPLDAAANALLFLPLGFLWRLSAASEPAREPGRAWLAAVLVSGALEFLQVWLPGRYPSLVDVAANSLGAWLGAVVHRRTESTLAARPAPRLALELPLMTLVYLLVPLLWLDGLAAGRDPTRLWLVPLLGVFGGGVLAAVWRHRLAAAGRVSAEGVAAAAAAWLLAAAFPALAAAPVFVLLCALGLAVVVRVEAVWPVAEGADRRFELPTLRRLWPLFAAYLVLIALWPWPWQPGPWRGMLGLGDLGDMPGVVPLLRVLEYLGGVTLAGYMLAEARGRRDGHARYVDRRGAAACLVGAAAIEGLRGFHPAHGASLVQLALAAGLGLYGGLVYRLQLGVVRRLLGGDR